MDLFEGGVKGNLGREREGGRSQETVQRLRVGRMRELLGGRIYVVVNQELAAVSFSFTLLNSETSQGKKIKVIFERRVHKPLVMLWCYSYKYYETIQICCLEVLHCALAILCYISQIPVTTLGNDFTRIPDIEKSSFKTCPEFCTLGLYSVTLGEYYVTLYNLAKFRVYIFSYVKRFTTAFRRVSFNSARILSHISSLLALKREKLFTIIV